MQAQKNGFFYVIDRTNGELLSAEKYVQATWATHIDLKLEGPLRLNSAITMKQKNSFFLVPSVDIIGCQCHTIPKQGLVYIPAQELYMPMKRDEEYEYDEKGWNTAGDLTVLAPPKNLLQLMLLARSIRGRLSAWDPVQQKEVWNQYLTLPWNGGTLSTDGNLVFQGTSDGDLVAYDARTGEKKWSKDLKMELLLRPSYSIDGKQYVTVLVGYGGVFALQAGLPPKNSGGPINGRIVTFALDGDLKLPERPRNIEMPKPPTPIEDQASIARRGSLSLGVSYVSWSWGS